PYLKELGINAVELLPIHEFNECEMDRINYWGYSTVSFFALMGRYGTITDFKTMVRELHRSGIEVILDVVFNHTAEWGNGGPTYSFKGIDCPVYYMMGSHHHFLNYSGCGNT